MQSRVQMQLFKARQMAARELEEALAKKGLTFEEARMQMRLRGYTRATAYPHAHGVAGTATRFVKQMRGGRMLAMLARLWPSHAARAAAR